MHIIIPARYASTRLPGKPLLDLGGKPLIQHVVERAWACAPDSVTVATDDERIREACVGAGIDVCMTSIDHRSGTDRLAEAVDKLGIAADDVVVNLQGDEPLMPADLLRQVAETLALHADAVMATACHAIRDTEAFNNPNVVKVVRDAQGYALYFSRAPIPWPRDGGPGYAYHHIGLYAYRAGFIKRYASWPACPLETIEQLEQLRVLWHGERIVVCETEAMPAAGVDTADDLARVRALLTGRNADR